MAQPSHLPRHEGQLVWCPSDPSLGIGVVTHVDIPRVWVRFVRLQEERAYTTRSTEVVISRYAIRPGERVRRRDGGGEPVRVSGVADADGDLLVYELEDGSEICENELIPDVRDIGPKERLGNLSLVHPDVVRARVQGLSLANLSARPGVSAVLGSRVLWLPHQIDVATRAIGRDPVRKLLADEVGLGKTVEAAMIFAGLRYEGRADRVLILTPNTLSIQWLGEIFRKSHELLVFLDKERIDDALQDFPDLSPFEAHQRIVTSIDLVCEDPVLFEEASESAWDLVVVDEAHHLKWRADGKSNKAYDLVERLSQKTRHLLLLTATPMALDPAEYHALLRLLDPARFDNPGAFESIRTRVVQIREVARSIAAAVRDRKAVPAAMKKNSG